MTSVNVELRHLRAFVAVAEELNFTRAAARLHLGQQALSAQIRQLEDRLGAQLFSRTTRKVVLTPAGRALLKHAPAAVAALDEAVAAVQEAAAATQRRLTIGLASTAPLELTAQILRSFAQVEPEVELVLRDVRFSDTSGGVRGGDSDVALTWLPCRADGLAFEPLISDAPVAVLPVDHPLLTHDVLTPAEIVAEPLAWVDDHDEVTQAFWSLADHWEGRTPTIGARMTNFDEFFAAVRAGRCIGTCPSSVAHSIPWPGIELRPIAGVREATVAVCWNPSRASCLVDSFVQTARMVASESPLSRTPHPVGERVVLDDTLVGERDRAPDVDSTLADRAIGLERERGTGL
jgi:DNA-binding transcriptional LysR family regulator